MSVNALASRRRLALLALPLAALAACATPTPYQPLGARGTGASGGFSEQRITPNRFLVTFNGNGFTSRQRVETYLLYRAAELTVQQGFDSFTIVDKATDRNVETRVNTIPGPGYGFGGAYGWWRPSWRYYGGGFGWRSWDPWFGDPFWADNIDVSTVTRFEANAEIVMRHGAAGNDVRAFDAREVMANLGPTIEVPKP